MMTWDARIGDKVKEVADGPVMTVFATDGGGNLHCEWDVAGTRNEATFLPDSLTMVSKGPMHDVLPSE